jgi:hypothetical protein
MRILQIVVFFVALAFFLGALAIAPTVEGLIFWRAGIAVMIIDIGLILLWPANPAQRGGPNDANVV